MAMGGISLLVVALFSRYIGFVHSYPSPLGDAIDLTYPVGNNITYQWPTLDPFQLQIIHRGPWKKYGDMYYETNKIIASEHSGTHMDAPVHLSEGSWRLDEIPWSRLAGPAVVVDISAKARDDPDAQLTVEDLKKYESKYGRIPHGAVVLMFSGQGEYYSNYTRYFGYEPGVFEENPKDVEHLHFPGFHPKAALWLTEKRSIVGVGVDTPSLDFGQSRRLESHVIFGRNNIWGLEHVAYLDKLPPKGYTIYAMVYKLQGGSGGPTRLFARPTNPRECVKENGQEKHTHNIWVMLLMLLYTLCV